MPARTVILRPNPFDGLPSVIVVVMTILVLLGVTVHAAVLQRRLREAHRDLAPGTPPGVPASAQASSSRRGQDRRTVAAVTDRLPTTDR